MKQSALLLNLLFALGLLGCQQPEGVKVTPDERTDDLVLTSFSAADTAGMQLPIDSAAVTPQEGIRFGGMILLNHVTYDAGAGLSSGAFSWVYFADRARRLQLGGVTFGFYGFNLAPRFLVPVTVNGFPMLRVAHRVKVLATTQPYGYEFVRDLTGEYSPGTLFRWQAMPDTIGSIDISIMSPESLTVYAPAGGTVLSRNQDVHARWTGRGAISLIISKYNPLTKKSRPVLQLKPRVNRGELTISRSILQLLPRDRFFVFSFVLANREEKTVVSRYPAEILVQAASVYNSYVELL